MKVVKLLPGRSRSAAARLLVPRPPLVAAAHAVCFGHAPGDVFADGERAGQCLVKAHYYEFSWFGGDDETWLASAIESTRPLCLVVPRVREWSPPRTERSRPFRNFSGCTLDERHLDLGHPELGQLQAVPLDRELLLRCGWLDEMLLATGSVDQYLRHSFGVVLLRENALVAEAYGAFLGDGACEVGVFVPEEHRGKGLGRRVVAQLLLEIRDRGLEPHWSCPVANAASAAVARAVGFREVDGFELLRYE